MGKTINSISLNSFNTCGVPFYAEKILKSFLRTSVRKRFKIIGRELDSSDADVICLQEVHAYPHLAVLRKALTNYPHCYYKKYLYGPRGGVVTFSKEELVEVEYIDFQKKGSFFNKSIVGKIGKRGILITKAKDSMLYFINTHLTQNSDHDWSESNRYIPMLKSQLLEITNILSLLGKKGSVILAGDFNMPKDSAMYEQFLVSTNIQDAFYNHFTATEIGKKVVNRIDYIFLSNDIHLEEILQQHIFNEKYQLENGNKTYLSDHIGLKISIKYHIASGQKTLIQN